MTGILYNIFVCLVSGIVALNVFWLLQRKGTQKKKYSSYLNHFSLFVGLIWLFVAVRLFFVWAERPALSVFVFRWIVGPLTYIHLLPGFYYFGWSFFDNKKIRFCFNSLFTFIAMLAVVSFFMYGFVVPETTYWGNNIIPNKISNRLFTYGLFLPAVPCILIEVIKRFKAWRITNGNEEKQLLGFSFGFLFYSLAGIFEALIFTQGWPMLLARTGIMFTPLTFYFFSTIFEEE